MQWMFISFIFAVGTLIISNRFYLIFAYHIYIFAIVLLLLTLAIGIEVKASKSWLGFGGLRFQPSEFAKLATALALSRLFARYDFRFETFRNKVKTMLILALPTGLILLQRDWGSALVFSAFLLPFYRQGMSGAVLAYIIFVIALFISTLLYPLDWILAAITLLTIVIAMWIYRKLLFRAIVGGLIIFGGGLIYKFMYDPSLSYGKTLVASVVGLFIVSMLYQLIKRAKIRLQPVVFFVFSVIVMYSADYTYNNVLKAHHRNRIEDMLGIKVDIRNAGYNVYQSKVAIGSGGWHGKGFMKGTQTKLNFVPEQSTDFIFCTVGEEWGFTGCFAVIFLYTFLMVRLIIIAERQKTIFARSYGYCVAAIIFFHVAINIAMTVGLAPVIGIPLPYMSAGGSSLLSFTLLLFIFLKMDASNSKQAWQE